MIRSAFPALFLLMIYMLSLPFAAQAQSFVSVRAGNHDGYSRLVFDGAGASEVRVEKEGDTQIRMIFTPLINMRGALPDLSAIQTINEITQDSGAWRISVVAGAPHRYFKIGNRLVLDVYVPVGGVPEKTGQTVQPAPEPEPASVQPETVEEMPETENEASDVQKPDDTELADVTESSENVQEGQENAEVEDLPSRDNAIESHRITLGATETIGLAAFRQGDMFWIASDRDDLRFEPRIQGPTPEKFQSLPPRPLPDGGVLYGIKLPNEMTSAMIIRADGGGVQWQFAVPALRANNNDLPLQRIIPDNRQVRGGSLIWPLLEARQVLKATDPETGYPLYLVTIAQADALLSQEYNLVDLDIIPSVAGLVVRAKKDDLSVVKTEEGVLISSGDGLVVSDIRSAEAEILRNKELAQIAAETKTDMTRIFDFSRWTLGGKDALAENETLLLSRLHRRNENGKIEDLLSLAKLNIANGRGAEAIGFLEFAEQERPDLNDNPEFLALKGAAEALDRKGETAFAHLMAPSLKDVGEIELWKSLILADLEDWQQAGERLPNDFSIVAQYPKAIQTKMALSLAEVALRKGAYSQANQLLSLLEDDVETLRPPQKAAWQYLQGEAERQSGDIEKAKEIWRGLSDGKDDYNRVKAGLAMASLESQSGDITVAEKIDRLERLRYAWRGDDLEARINYELGQSYFEAGDYIKGLNIMRDASSFAKAPDLSQRITNEMSQTFANLFLTETLKDVSAFDAVAVYEEFPELTPPGAQGDRLVQQLAERLITAGLLGRAADILENQVERRLEGAEKARVGKRLAYIQYLDDKTDEALNNLAVVENIYNAQTEEQFPEKTAKLTELTLLKAQVLAKAGQTKRALDLLESMPQTTENTQMRVEISWNAGFWDDAAFALQDVIAEKNISGRRSLESSDADVILSLAVAMNLSGDRIGLANIRKKYAEAMRQTPRAQFFDVVTREWGSGMLADRDRLNEIISEADLFSGFMESYKNEAAQSLN